MKLQLFAGAMLAAVAAARTTPEDLAAGEYSYSFDDLLDEFELSYPEGEIAKRQEIFAKNMERIQQHNEAGTSS